MFEQRFGASSTLHAMAYAGNRKVVQYLAIPALTQRNPSVPAASCIPAAWSTSTATTAAPTCAGRGKVNLPARPLEFTLGGNYDQQEQLRRGYENFIGAPAARPHSACAARCAATKPTASSNFDQFAQAWWQFADRWSLLAGVRHSEVNFESDGSLHRAAPIAMTVATSATATPPWWAA